MQALKVSSLAHRLPLLKYPARITCVSKYFPYYGDRPVQYDNRSYSSLSQLKKASIQPISCAIGIRFKQTSTDKDKDIENASALDEETEKLSLFKRYKKMLKEYWYVLIPVHMVTSAVWFGGFYYAAKGGLDIVPFLELINLPESLIQPLRNSALGYIAVASALYKLATPARYMVTLGGTTFAVKFLTKRGLIRPVPTKAEIKDIIQKKLKKDGVDKDK